MISGLSNAEEQELGADPQSFNPQVVLGPGGVTVEYRGAEVTWSRQGYGGFLEPTNLYRRSKWEFDQEWQRLVPTCTNESWDVWGEDTDKERMWIPSSCDWMTLGHSLVWDWNTNCNGASYDHTVGQTWTNSSGTAVECYDGSCSTSAVSNIPLNPCTEWWESDIESDTRRSYAFADGSGYMTCIQTLHDAYGVAEMEADARAHLAGLGSSVSGTGWTTGLTFSCGITNTGFASSQAYRDLASHGMNIELGQVQYRFVKDDAEVGTVYTLSCAEWLEPEGVSTSIVEEVYSLRFHAKSTNVVLSFEGIQGAAVDGVQPDYEMLAPEVNGNRELGIIAVELIDDAGHQAHALTISKWSGAFSGTGEDPVFDSAFVESDADHFRVRVSGLRTEEMAISAFLSTDHPGSSAWDDGDTETTLYQSASGIYTSKSMILVSNEIDDDERHHGTDGHISGGSDDSLDDRTHIARLQSTVNAHFSLKGTDCEARAIIPKPKKVFLNVKILKDGSGNDAVVESEIEDMLELARELFSQVGIELEWNSGSMTITSNPPGVDLTDGITLIDINGPPTGLTPEAQAIIEHLGTADTNADLHLFVVEPLLIPTTLGNPIGEKGYSLNSSWSGYVNEDYLFNAFLVNEDEFQGQNFSSEFTLAHELMHLLGITGHVVEQQWRLIHPTDIEHDDINNTKRITSDEQATFYSSPHVESVP